MNRLLGTTLLCAFLAACGGASRDGDPQGAGGAGGGGGAGERPFVPASARAVTFTSAAPDAFAHAGTLQIPGHDEGARLPAVVFAHGSGPNDRDGKLGGQLLMGFGFEIPIFAELGDALQEAGFVVLRFDKRTCGPFNGCADNGYPAPEGEITIDTFVADAEGALAFLAAQPEVDPARLFFVGHSKGASYAPRLLTEHRALRAGVMLAGAYHTVEHTLRAQMEKVRAVYEEAGATEAQIEQALGDLPQAVADLDALHEGTFAGTTIWGQPIAYWNSWLRLGNEAPGLALALDRPLLVLSGDYDWNVPKEETEAWATAFGAESIHRAQVVPCVSHALNCIHDPDWRTIGEDDIDAHVDPRVIDAVVSFLAANARE